MIELPMGVIVLVETAYMSKYSIVISDVTCKTIAYLHNQVDGVSDYFQAAQPKSPQGLILLICTQRNINKLTQNCTWMDIPNTRTQTTSR